MARGGFERPPRWAVVAIAVGLLALAGLVAFTGGQRAKDPVSPAELARMNAAAAAAQASEDAARPRRVAFLGDSYVAGSAMDSGDPAKRWPSQTCRALGWEQAGLFAEGGTGYVNPGAGKTTFAQRVPAVIASTPDVVIVAGGLNDRTYPAADVGVAAKAVFQALRKGLPHATIVVVGPFYPAQPVTAELLAVRDAVHAAASSSGLAFVDPLPWFANGAIQIGSDGLHPTDAGHAALAQAATAAFRHVPTLAASIRP